MVWYTHTERERRGEERERQRDIISTHRHSVTDSCEECSQLKDVASLTEGIEMVVG